MRFRENSSHKLSKTCHCLRDTTLFGSSYFPCLMQNRVVAVKLPHGSSCHDLPLCTTICSLFNVFIGSRGKFWHFLVMSDDVIYHLVIFHYSHVKIRLFCGTINYVKVYPFLTSIEFLYFDLQLLYINSISYSVFSNKIIQP